MRGIWPIASASKRKWLRFANFFWNCAVSCRPCVRSGTFRTSLYLDTNFDSAYISDVYKYPVGTLLTIASTWETVASALCFRTNHTNFVGLDPGARKYSIMCVPVCMYMYVCTCDLPKYIAYHSLSAHNLGTFNKGKTHFIGIDLWDTCTLKALLTQGHCQDDQLWFLLLDPCKRFFAVSSSVGQDLPHVPMKSLPSHVWCSYWPLWVRFRSPQKCTVQRHAVPETDTARISCTRLLAS